jgi:hypothetical protein
MGDPERVQFNIDDDIEDPNPRATPVRPKPQWREWGLGNRIHFCAICARRGFNREVERLENGDPTGLCAHHNEYERELRRELGVIAQSQKLTRDVVKAARERVSDRLRGNP